MAVVRDEARPLLLKRDGDDETGCRQSRMDGASSGDVGCWKTIGTKPRTMKMAMAEGMDDGPVETTPTRNPGSRAVVDDD